MSALWDTELCSLVEVDRCFGDAYCLHHLGDWISSHKTVNSPGRTYDSYVTHTVGITHQSSLFASVVCFICTETTPVIMHLRISYLYHCCHLNFIISHYNGKAVEHLPQLSTFFHEECFNFPTQSKNCTNLNFKFTNADSLRFNAV
jgi:hypothetical protein